MTPIYRNI